MKGMTIQLCVKTQTGTDEWGAPIYSETLVDVNDVLVGQPSSDDVITTLQTEGKKIVYTLGIPKGDTHEWEDTYVVIWGKKYSTVGNVMTGIQENIPLRWGGNIRVCKYE